jgi:hypothetical protein
MSETATLCKICISCCLPKSIRKEEMKTGEIHEYNYSCYECLNKLRKQRLSIFEGLQEIGILDFEEDVKADKELDMIEKMWNIIIKLRNKKRSPSI